MDDWVDQARTQRVLEGVRRRGVINPSTDPRCFLREAIEELLDCLNYTRWGHEKGQISEKDWRHVDQITRYVIEVIGTCCPGAKIIEGSEAFSLFDN